MPSPRPGPAGGHHEDLLSPRAAQGWWVLTPSYGSQCSPLVISGPAWLCGHMRVCHVWPFLGLRPSGLPVLESPGQLRSCMGSAHCATGMPSWDHPSKAPGTGPGRQMLLLPPGHLFPKPAVRLTFPRAPGLNPPIPVPVPVTPALSRLVLQTAASRCEGFSLTEPEQKTVCARLVAACGKTKPRRIVCRGKGRRDRWGRGQ